MLVGNFVEALLSCTAAGIAIWDVVQAVWGESQRPKLVVVAFARRRWCMVVVALTRVIVFNRGLWGRRRLLKNQSVGYGGEYAAATLDGAGRRWRHKPKCQVVVSGSDDGWRTGWCRSGGSVCRLTVLPLLQLAVHSLVDSREGLDTRVIRYSPATAMWNRKRLAARRWKRRSRVEERGGDGWGWQRYPRWLWQGSACW